MPWANLTHHIRMLGLSMILMVTYRNELLIRSTVMDQWEFESPRDLHDHTAIEQASMKGTSNVEKLC